MHCIAVATAPAPAGPYADHGPIARRDGAQAIGYIDAWPLITRGRAYIPRISTSMAPATTASPCCR